MEILGIKDIELIKEPDVDHGLDSWVYKADDQCLIVKRVKSDPYNYASKVQDSIEHSSELSDEILPNSYVVVLQGQIDGEVVPVVARVVPWMDDVHCICDMKPKDVLRDRELVDSLCKIYRFGFKQVVNGKHFDLLRPKRTNCNMFLKSLLCVFSKNIMTGKDMRSDRRRVFIDNGTYLDVSSDTLKRIAYSSLYLRNLLIYEFIRGIKSKKSV